MLTTSSQAYLIPTVYSAYVGNWPYALLSLNLFASSQFYHRRYCKPTFIWDQTAIFAHWFYGLYLLSGHEWADYIPYAVVSLYMWTIFYGGKVTKTMCFGPRADIWHSTVHLSSSLALVLTQHNLTRELAAQCLPP